MQQYRQLVLSHRPVGYWSFGEAAGSAFGDVAYGQTGTWDVAPTLGVPGLVPAHPGKAARTNGTGRGSVPHNARLNASTAVAIELWMRAEATQASFLGLVEKGDGTNGGLNYTLGFRTYWQFFTRGLSTLTDTSVNETIVVGKLYHVIGIEDGSRMRIVVNGVVRDDQAVAGAFNATGSVLAIGSRGGGGSICNATMDEVAIYTDANVPSLAAFRQHYRVGLGQFPSRRMGRAA